MSDEQLDRMYGDVPKDKIRVHKWRTDVVTVGEVPAEMVETASGGHLNCPWPAQREFGIDNLLRFTEPDLLYCQYCPLLTHASPHPCPVLSSFSVTTLNSQQTGGTRRT